MKITFVNVLNKSASLASYLVILSLAQEKSLIIPHALRLRQSQFNICLALCLCRCCCDLRLHKQNRLISNFWHFRSSIIDGLIAICLVKHDMCGSSTLSLQNKTCLVFIFWWSPREQLISFTDTHWHTQKVTEEPYNVCKATGAKLPSLSYLAEKWLQT